MVAGLKRRADIDKDFAKSNDIGGAGGVSLEFGGGLLLDVRYSFGPRRSTSRRST